jgi:PPOX class probable F420-dependent enzyme
MAYSVVRLGRLTHMQMPRPTLTERLERERNVWLCTLRPDGSPHVTPVWFVYIGARFWISSGTRNVKVRNVGNDPRVSLALEDGDAPCVAEGNALVHHGRLRDDVLAALAAKYDGWDAAAEIEPSGPRVLIEVPVERWLLNGVAQ